MFFNIEDPRPIILPMMPPKMKRIMLEVCYKHDIHPNEIMGQDVCPKYTIARTEFCVRCRKEAEYSLPRIGKAINRDHTTVLHAIRKCSPDETFEPIKIKRPAFKSYLNGVLTARQNNMLKMESEGISVLEMAKTLNISDETARRHIRAAHQKMTSKKQIKKLLDAYDNVKKETPQAGEPAAL